MKYGKGCKIAGRTIAISKLAWFIHQFLVLKPKGNDEIWERF
jgi:hypothetical protein